MTFKRFVRGDFGIGFLAFVCLIAGGALVYWDSERLHETQGQLIAENKAQQAEIDRLRQKTNQLDKDVFALRTRFDLTEGGRKTAPEKPKATPEKKAPPETTHEKPKAPPA